LLDQNGNSPLHYAAKYGHLDLCKYLVERGSMVNIKNKQLQTPYDISESHAVRQYLLPLQFQAERENPTDMCETTSFQSNSFPLRYHLSAEAPLPTTSYGPPSSSGVANTAIPLAPISYSVPPTNGISNKINTSSRVFQPGMFMIMFMKKYKLNLCYFARWLPFICVRSDITTKIWAYY